MKFIDESGMLKTTMVNAVDIAIKIPCSGTYISKEGEITVNRSRNGVIQISSRIGKVIGSFWGRPKGERFIVATTFESNAEVERFLAIVRLAEFDKTDKGFECVESLFEDLSSNYTYIKIPKTISLKQKMLSKTKFKDYYSLIPHFVS